MGRQKVKKIICHLAPPLHADIDSIVAFWARKKPVMPEPCSKVSHGKEDEFPPAIFLITRRFYYMYLADKSACILWTVYKEKKK